MKLYRPLFLFSAIAFFAVACSPDESVYQQDILQNPACRNIIKLKDKRDAKALIPYFIDVDYQLRQQAVMAFGSFKDTAALNSLYTMLEEDEPIAQAAAFSIGQIGDTRSVSVLQRILERSFLPETRFEIYDAMGKCGTIELNYYLASNYNVNKDAKGTAWALMELANKKQLNPAGVTLAITILENENDKDVRFGAANALARTQIQIPWKRVKHQFLKENLQDVKMALALDLRTVPVSEIDNELIANIRSSFYITQINALTAFSSKNNKYINDWVNDILHSNTNINLKIAAAEYLVEIPNKSILYLQKEIADTLNWRVRTILYSQAIQKGNKEIIDDSFSRYNKTHNLYEKGMLLESLGQLPGKKEWLKDQIMENDSIVSTYGMEAMVSLIKNSDHKALYAPYLFETIRSNHDAVVSLTAIACRDSIFSDLIDVNLLINRQRELILPEQMETFMELQKSIHFFTGESEPVNKVKYNHPIEVNHLAELDSLKGFNVITTKGEFFMKVYPDEAPGAVQNIKNLVDQGFYNQKLFHRVVPAFVAQTGCPDGDGWGGLDYTVRSEFSMLRYSRGAVGMASIGPDTENCQWFVTFAPTPHLNGRYTLFAFITEGMEIVDQLEIGDRIIKMNPVYHKAEAPLD